MKKVIIITLAGALLLISIAVWKILGSDTAGDARRQPAPLVKAEKPGRTDLQYKLSFTGDVLPNQQANIYAKVSGTLERVYVDMGTYVHENELLALIDTTELSQQVRQTGATFVNAKLNYTRTKDLLEQKLVSQEELDNADAALKVAQANYDGAKTRLGFARIKAPFSGFVTKRSLDAGALIAGSNTMLFTLMDIDEVKIVVNVLEKDIQSIQIGKQATIVCDAFKGKEFRGAIVRLSQSLDLATRTMALEIDVPNSNRDLKPGMFATVGIILEERKNSIVVPTLALQADDHGSFLYFLEGNIARRRNVVIGVEQDTFTEIMKGLSGDEMVIVAGQQLVRDGGPVTVQR